MTALQPYPAYKDSGVEWLGEVPEHWEVRRLGTFGRFFKGSGGTKADEAETGVPCVRYGDLYTRHQFHITKSKACVAPHRAEAYTPIRYGDVLFAGSGETLGEIGKSAVNLLRRSAVCGGDVIVFRPTMDVDAEFIGWSTDCRQAASQKARMGRGITVMHIYSGDLKYLSVPLPPLPEQIAIARFLDDADRRIRRYIRAKERLIELLEEQKQAVIHQTVTGMVDIVTGKPYPAYKESGVAWLGKVPEQWEVRRLRNVGQAIIGLTYAPRDVGSEEDGILVLRASNISDGRIVDADNVFVRCSVPNRLVTRVGDILICSRSGSKALIGKNARIESGSSGVTFGAFMTIFRCKNNDYLYFVFNSKLFEYQSGAFLTSTINQLTLGTLYSIKIPLPPPADQERIVLYLVETAGAFDKAIAHSRRQIEFLREYRIRLIADVVTGRLDVREAAARLPDVDPIGDGGRVDATQPGSKAPATEYDTAKEAGA